MRLSRSNRAFGVKRFRLIAAFAVFFASACHTTAQSVVTQELRIPIKGSGTLGLDAVMVRPNDSAPHPLALFTHGTPRDSHDRAGMTPFAEHFALGIKDLLPMAFAECAASVDKGLPKTDLQAAWFGAMGTSDGFPSGILADTLGLPDLPVTRVENSCATGNDAVINARETLAMKRLPPELTHRVAMAFFPLEDPALAGVLFEGEGDALVATLREIADRPGPIVRLQALTPARLAGGEDYNLAELVEECAIATNTAAAGGNASLMTIG